MSKHKAVRGTGLFARLQQKRKMLLARMFFGANPDFHLIVAREEAAHIHELSLYPQKLLRLIAAMIYTRLRDSQDLPPRALDDLLQRLEQMAARLDAYRRSDAVAVSAMVDLLDVPMEIEKTFAALRCNRIIFVSFVGSTHESRAAISYFNRITGLNLWHLD